MGSGMPEIGSRISLISKADIRYEGKLFSVDPDECTIALSSVRSYGTEDRKTTYPVPAQHQVYDFILFRGSDIKDIRVLTTTIPNDPAIVQLSVPPSLSTIESQFESDGDFRSGAAGSSNRLPAAGSSRPSQTFQNSGFKPSAVFANLEQVLKHPVPNAASEDGSRSSTPSAHIAKNAEPPLRTSISSNKSDDAQPQRKQTYGNREANRSQPQYQNRYQNQQNQQGKPQYQQRYQQNRYPQQQQQQQQQQQRYPQQSQYRDYNNREYNGRDNQYRNYNEYREGYGQRQYMQPLRGNVQRSDNWVNYNQRRRPNQGMPNQNYQAGGYQNQNQNQNRRPRNTLKFDEEYDFEQANSQFEEVRLQMSKVKIEDADKVNGDVEKKEDSGNEVSGGEETELDPESKDQCYDKVKSFFDNISYEAIERSKGLTARLDWKTERKINSETFGQVALRRNLNNYRRRMNNGAQGGNGYYQNYQNNRNQGMQNQYRSGYNNRLQGNRPRRQFPPGDQEESKENQVAA